MSILDSSCMISVFPESSPPFFSDIIFSAGATGNKLNTSGYGICVSIDNQEMDMVRCHGKIEDA